MFWKDTLNAWTHFCNLNSPKTYEDCLATPLWLNPDISDNLFIPNWFKNNINIVNDLIDTDGSVKTLGNIMDQYKVHRVDFLTYHRLKLSIIIFKAKFVIPTTQHIKLQPPIIPFHLRALINVKKGFYSIFNPNTKKVYINQKWNLDLELDEPKWREIYAVCFKTVQDNYLVWLQYKILNRILGVKRFLKIINVSLDSACRLCSYEDETLNHLFCECRKVQPLWQNISNWINNKLGYRLNIDNETKLFSQLGITKNHIPLNTILLVTNGYIFWCARSKKDPDIFQLQTWVERIYNEQKAMAYKNLKQQLFQHNWNHWSALFD